MHKKLNYIDNNKQKLSRREALKRIALNMAAIAAVPLISSAASSAGTAPEVLRYSSVADGSAKYLSYADYSSRYSSQYASQYSSQYASQYSSQYVSYGGYSSTYDAYYNKSYYYSYYYNSYYNPASYYSNYSSYYFSYSSYYQPYSSYGSYVRY